MAYMGCYPAWARPKIEARAREIMKELRLAACNCGDSERGHAPDCERVFSEDAAWDRAIDQAAEDLANLVVGADVEYACIQCKAVRGVYIPNGKARPRTGVCAECDGETEAITMFDVALGDAR